jgi:putative membrane protein
MSYNRFFEGRGHCGKFVHSARTLCRRARTHLHPVDDPQVIKFKKTLGRYLTLFAIVQKHSIRHTESEAFSEAEGVDGLLKGLTDAQKEELQPGKKNLPQTVLIWIGQEVVTMRPYMIHPDVLIWMEESIQSLMEGWMGMHKLATTPMPFPFIQMLLTLMYIWMYTLPFPVASNFGWASPPVAVLLGLALFGLNAIGAELEDPMGEETNDLPYDVFEGAVKGAIKVCQLGWPENKAAAEGNSTTAAPAEVEALSPDNSNRSVTALSPANQSQMNPIHSQTSPGVPMTPSATPPAAAVSPPPVMPDNKPHVNYVGGFAGELITATCLADCSAGLKDQLTSLFDRYDMDGSKTISITELRQLVTNVSYSLKLGKNNKALQAQVDENTMKDIEWKLDDFVKWLLQAAKNLDLNL